MLYYSNVSFLDSRVSKRTSEALVFGFSNLVASHPICPYKIRPRDLDRTLTTWINLGCPEGYHSEYLVHENSVN